MIALQPGPPGAFMQQLGTALDREFGRPRAVLVISAHTTANRPVALAAAQHEAIYDFGGFAPALYQLRYDAPGEPTLAEQVVQRLSQSGRPAQAAPQGGLDHGIWTVLRYLYPNADVPVVPLTLQTRLTPQEQFELGQALGELDDVLMLGTGSMTHNLRMAYDAMGRVPESQSYEQTEVAQSREFRQWFVDRSAALDWPALWDYRRQAPHGALMHPTDEHLLPWYVAAGVGGAQTPPQRLHASVSYGCLAMDAYGFGEGATRLAKALR